MSAGRRIGWATTITYGPPRTGGDWVRIDASRGLAAMRGWEMQPTSVAYTVTADSEDAIEVDPRVVVSGDMYNDRTRSFREGQSMMLDLNDAVCPDFLRTLARDAHAAGSRMWAVSA